MKTEETAPKKSYGKIRSYFRELSIVIIGVLVTLMITSMIGNWNRQRELKGMMHLISEELQRNLLELEWTTYRWNEEQGAFKVLTQYGENWRQIPKETLENYKQWIGSLPTLDVESDFYETLKSSTLAQEIKEKEMLPRLSALYKRLAVVQGQLERYSEQKSLVMTFILENLPEQGAESWMSGEDPYTPFTIAVGDRGFRTFMITGGSIPTPGIFESLPLEIRETIGELEKYGY